MKEKEKIITEKEISDVEVPVAEDKEKAHIERLQRLQAEFENFRKRSERERVDIVANGNANLIFQLLEVLDSFELSLKDNKDEGVLLIYEEFSEILERQGLKKIDATGIFNPKYHEALIQVEGETQGAILEELQVGYLLNDKLLRASKVKISTVTEKK